MNYNWTSDVAVTIKLEKENVITICKMIETEFIDVNVQILFLAIPNPIISLISHIS